MRHIRTIEYVKYPVFFPMTTVHILICMKTHFGPDSSEFRMMALSNGFCLKSSTNHRVDSYALENDQKHCHSQPQATLYSSSLSAHYFLVEIGEC